MAKGYKGRYRMTPKRRAALKKAQLVSARKRKGLSGKKKVAIGAAGVLAAGVAYHKVTKSQFSIRVGKNDNSLRITPQPRNAIDFGTNNFGVTKAQARRGRSTKKANRMSGHRDVFARVSVADRFVLVSWRHKGGLRKSGPGPAPKIVNPKARIINQGHDKSHIPVNPRHGVLIWHGAGKKLI